MNLDLKPQIAVIDQKNINIPGISKYKKSTRLIIEQVQYQHKYDFEKNLIGEIV